MAGSPSSGARTQDEPGAPVKHAPRYFPSAVFDGFLPESEADAILRFAIANEARFHAATVVRSAGLAVDDGLRRSYDFAGEADEWAGALVAALRARAGELAAAVGVPPFPVGGFEMTLNAYRDGCFYSRHIDTVVGQNRRVQRGERALTAVYYVNREPAAFTGGVLELLPLAGDGEPQSLPPRHNRLVAFPPFAPHRVAQAYVPGDRFADARFSVNCWIHRAPR